MKLNELNKIEEGIMSSIKGLFTGQGDYQTRVQDIFIKDFVQDALTSLNNGVKGGLIDPAAKSAASVGKSTQYTAPASGAGPATGAAGSTIPTGQNANPLNAPMASGAPKSSVSTRLSTPSAPGSVTTGGAGMKIKETPYDKMNRVFESIINIDEAVDLRTISDFMMEWFTQYMQGVNWDSSKAIVQQKLEKLQNEYPKNVKQNLTDLAKIGLALSKVGTPAGAPQEYSQAQQQQRQTTASTYRNVQDELEYLARTDPSAYNRLIKDLKPVRTGFMYEDDQ